MAREVQCPKGHAVTVSDAEVGQSVKCATCGESFVAAAAEKSAPAAAASAPPGPRVRVPAQVLELSQRLSWLTRYCLPTSRALVILGLLIVVFARGCDAVGRRSAAAVQAREQVARNEFDDRWAERTDAVQADINAFQERVNELQAIAQPNDDQKKELEVKKKGLEDARKKLEGLQKDRDKERRNLEAGRWRDYRIAARDADRYQQLKGPGREKWFVFGTLLLVFGLLGVSSISKGMERWVALVVLVIILLSYYNMAVVLGGRI